MSTWWELLWCCQLEFVLLTYLQPFLVMFNWEWKLLMLMVHVMVYFHHVDSVLGNPSWTQKVTMIVVMQFTC